MLTECFFFFFFPLKTVGNKKTLNLFIDIYVIISTVATVQCSIQTTIVHVIIQVTAKHCYIAVLMLAPQTFSCALSCNMFLKIDKKNVKFLYEMTKTLTMKKKKHLLIVKILVLESGT